MLNAIVADKVTTIGVFQISYNYREKMNFECMRSFFIVCTFVDKSSPSYEKKKKKKGNSNNNIKKVTNLIKCETIQNLRINY